MRNLQQTCDGTDTRRGKHGSLLSSKLEALVVARRPDQLMLRAQHDNTDWLSKNLSHQLGILDGLADNLPQQPLHDVARRLCECCVLHLVGRCSQLVGPEQVHDTQYRLSGAGPITPLLATALLLQTPRQPRTGCRFKQPRHATVAVARNAYGEFHAFMTLSSRDRTTAPTGSGMHDWQLPERVQCDRETVPVSWATADRLADTHWLYQPLSNTDCSWKTLAELDDPFEHIRSLDNTPQDVARGCCSEERVLLAAEEWLLRERPSRFTSFCRVLVAFVLLLCVIVGLWAFLPASGDAAGPNEL